MRDRSDKSKIIEQLLSDMDLNKFKEYLGMIKKHLADTDETLAKSGFTRIDIERMIEGLISEMVLGKSADIKCILHNFLKASSKKDPLFQQRVSFLLITRLPAASGLPLKLVSITSESR